MDAGSNVESNAVFFYIQLQHQSMLIANGIAIIAFFVYTGSYNVKWHSHSLGSKVKVG